MSDEPLFVDEEAMPAPTSQQAAEAIVHALLTKRLIEALNAPDPSPGILNAALRFCKDNDISAFPVAGSALEELKDVVGKLPFNRTG